MSRLKAHKKTHGIWKVPQKMLIKLIEKEKVSEEDKEFNELQCKICGGVMLTGSALRRHMKEHKAAGDKRKQKIDLQCKLCGHISSTIDAMRMHHYMHRKKILKHDILCTWNGCNETFFSHKALVFHLFRKHKNSRKREFYCDVILLNVFLLILRLTF